MIIEKAFSGILTQRKKYLVTLNNYLTDLYYIKEKLELINQFYIETIIH